MKYDTSVPLPLRRTQEWFASIITRPIDSESHMNPIAPSGIAMAEEALNYIAPSPTMKSHERIELYNQQYWWRLLNALQESFPFVLRLFGYHAFNEEIAVPYLQKFPPDTWALAYLGMNLPRWIEENYHQKDKQLVKGAAELDWCFNECFICGEEASIKQGDLVSEADLEKNIVNLQPSVQIFAWKNDLMAFRESFMAQEPEYWIDHDFPLLPKGKKFYAVFRNKANLMTWRELFEGEYHLLNAFKKGSTISAAIDSLEKCEPAVSVDAQKHLHVWFQDFIFRKWLCIKK